MVENGREQRVQCSTWSTESTGTLWNTEDGREQRVQCSTWSTESTGTLGEHRQYRMTENIEYSVVHGVQRVQEHWGNTEDSREWERTESTV